jgi:hypothetical protein
MFKTKSLILVSSVLGIGALQVRWFGLAVRPLPEAGTLDARMPGTRKPGSPVDIRTPDALTPDARNA